VPQFFPELPEAVPADIRQVDATEMMRHVGLAAGETDLLVGGPPCVAFSKSGFHLEYKRKGLDPRANLLDDYLRFVEELRPVSFLLENVFGLAYRNQSSPWFRRLITGLRRLGYSVSSFVLNAADYGVPQNRQRLFVIGSRVGTPVAPPVPTHWGEHERRVRPTAADALKPHVTSGEALEGLAGC
jgi:DNA (cytosine-5)-methyltransferase 1